MLIAAIDGWLSFETPSLAVTEYQNDGLLPVSWRTTFAANGIALSNDVTVTVRAEDREWLVKDNENGETYLIKYEPGTVRIFKPTTIIADGGGAAIGVGASGQGTGGALSIGVSQADNTINNTSRG